MSRYATIITNYLITVHGFTDPDLSGLTSLQCLDLTLFIEDKVGVMLPAEVVTEENFSSAMRISCLVEEAQQ